MLYNILIKKQEERNEIICHEKTLLFPHKHTPFLQLAKVAKYQEPPRIFSKKNSIITSQ